MAKFVHSAACLAAVALLAAACGSNGREYAYESKRHPTAAEQLFGTTGGPVSTTPPTSPTVVTEPAPLPSALVLAPSSPRTVPQPVARVPASDATFVHRVAASNAAEIELARLAYVRSESPDVRAFARQMLIDHRDMAIKLDNFTLERGYLIAWQIEPDKAATIDRLSDLTGAAFDRAYMDEMAAAHEQAVATLEAQAVSGRETETVASEFLPKVRHHREMARELDARL